VNSMCSQNCQVVAVRRDDKLPYVVCYRSLNGLYGLAIAFFVQPRINLLCSLVHAPGLQNRPYDLCCEPDAHPLACPPMTP
jgi:hypothetical protein